MPISKFERSALEKKRDSSLLVNTREGTRKDITMLIEQWNDRDSENSETIQDYLKSVR